MISAAIERCAGIDVGKKFLAVCVMVGPLEGEPRVEIRKIGTVRTELEGLRDWLKQEGVTHVVMESTGNTAGRISLAGWTFRFFRTVSASSTVASSSSS